MFKKETRILIISPNLKDWMCNTLYKEQKAIIDLNPDSLFCGPGFDLYDENINKIVQDNGITHVLIYADFDYWKKVSWEYFNIKKRPIKFKLRNVKVPKLLWINDCWKKKAQIEYLEYIRKNKIDYCFGTYYSPFGPKKITQWVPKMFAHPRSGVFINHISGIKRYDILLSGMRSDFYPFRTKGQELIKNKLKNKYKIFMPQHPGYRFIKEIGCLPCRENYARIINQSKIHFFGTSIYRLPFIKLFETIANKCLLVCNEFHGAKELGFVDGKTYVDVNEKNLIEKIKYYLENEDERNKIINRAFKLFKEKHTTNIRTKELAEKIKELQIK